MITAMKKFTALLLVLSLVFAFAACSDSDSVKDATNTDAISDDTGNVPTTKPTAQGAALGIKLDTGMKEKLDQLEYAAYVDIFYNHNTGDYADKTFTKDGVFGSIEDAYAGKTRYYVWGYADTTKCCDYQWEFVMPEGVEIPESGSYVTITGKFTYAEEALDKYWFTDVELTVEENFTDAGYDFDLTTVSPTLARVEIQNMQAFPDQFSGKTVRVFGRALTTNSVQHPYYDNAWAMDFRYDGDTKFAIGDDILVTGAFTAQDGGSFLEADTITKLA